MKPGDIVVYTPPGVSVVDAFANFPRFVVTGHEDEDGYVPIVEIDVIGLKPEFEYAGDLTKVDK